MVSSRHHLTRQSWPCYAPRAGTSTRISPRPDGPGAPALSFQATSIIRGPTIGFVRYIAALEGRVPMNDDTRPVAGSGASHSHSGDAAEILRAQLDEARLELQQAE